MGFEVFVNWFENGAPAPVPFRAVHATFGSAAGTVEPHGFRVHYGPADESYVYAKADESGMLTGVMVEKPCGDLQLWDGVVALLGLGHGVCYWPGGACAVGNAEAIRHLPSDMASALGEPTVVASGTHLAQAVEEA